LSAVWDKYYNELFQVLSEGEVKRSQMNQQMRYVYLCIEPKSYINSIYNLVRYILDYYLNDLQNYNNKNNNNNNQNNNNNNNENNENNNHCEEIITISKCLSSLIWEHDLIPIETIILALMNRAKLNNLVNSSSSSLQSNNNSNNNSNNINNNINNNNNNNNNDSSSAKSKTNQGASSNRNSCYAIEIANYLFI